MNINKALDTIYRLQIVYKNLHVGGSIGLFLHGIDLGRSDFNDIDFCIDKDEFIDTMEESYNSGSDFDYKKIVDGVEYEIRIDPMQIFQKKLFAGKVYNVSELAVIVKYKELYAQRGYDKHVKDLEIIYKQIGKKILEPADDLPF